MTWAGQCRQCRSIAFTLTISSGGWVLANCANCDAYIGQITADRLGTILAPDPLIAEPH